MNIRCVGGHFFEEAALQALYTSDNPLGWLFVRSMDELKQNQALVLALVGIGVVIVVIGLWFAWATASRQRKERMAILRDREMAVIAERVETTGGARLCILLLVFDGDRNGDRLLAGDHRVPAD